MKKFITKRKSVNGVNVEFEIQYLKLKDDKKFYGVSQIPFIETTDEIVKNINKEPYYTKDSDGNDSKVTIAHTGKGLDSSYIKSIANDGKTDNIDNLPNY